MSDQAMEQARTLFAEGMGAACASSGVLSQLQGRIFGALFLAEEPLSLDEIAEALQISKSNVSINIRNLVEWHLVRRVTVRNSRRDHYEAASDFWRVMQEIMERRFRWNIRQVIAACDETSRTAKTGRGPAKERQFVDERLAALRSFCAAVDAGIEAFARGEAIAPQQMQSQQLQSIRITGGDKR